MPANIATLRRPPWERRGRSQCLLLLSQRALGVRRADRLIPPVHWFTSEEARCIFAKQDRWASPVKGHGSYADRACTPPAEIGRRPCGRRVWRPASGTRIAVRVDHGAHWSRSGSGRWWPRQCRWTSLTRRRPLSTGIAATFAPGERPSTTSVAGAGRSAICIPPFSADLDCGQIIPSDFLCCRRIFSASMATSRAPAARAGRACHFPPPSPPPPALRSIRRYPHARSRIRYGRRSPIGLGTPRGTWTTLGGS